MNKEPTYTTLFGLMELSINHALQLDPATLNRLARLSGRAIEINCTSPQLTVFLRPHSQGITLQSYYEYPADCRIEGTAVALLKLLSAEHKSHALLDNKINLSGDIELSQILQTLLTDIDLDWEGRLAEYIGDMAAHQIGNRSRALYRWSQSVSHSMLLNIEEYLHEETRELPPRAELEHFYRSIDTLALKTDRLAARIVRLQKNASALSSQPKDHSA